MSDEAKAMTPEREAFVRDLMAGLDGHPVAMYVAREILATLDAERARADEATRIANENNESWQKTQAELRDLKRDVEAARTLLGVDGFSARTLPGLAEDAVRRASRVESGEAHAMMQSAEWKARAEKAEEGQNALAAEVRRMRERAEAADAALAAAHRVDEEMRTQLARATAERDAIAEKVREACVRVAVEIAGTRGQVFDSAEYRLKHAIDVIRSLDLAAILEGK